MLQVWAGTGSVQNAEVSQWKPRSCFPDSMVIEKPRSAVSRAERYGANLSVWLWERYLLTVSCEISPRKWRDAYCRNRSPKPDWVLCRQGPLIFFSAVNCDLRGASVALAQFTVRCRHSIGPSLSTILKQATCFIWTSKSLPCIIYCPLDISATMSLLVRVWNKLQGVNQHSSEFATGIKSCTGLAIWGVQAVGDLVHLIHIKCLAARMGPPLVLFYF